jgi:type I restriction enzyme S subunit
MKKGWEIKRLGELCKVISGQSPEGKYYNNVGDGLPFYQGKKEFGDKFIGDPTTWTTKITKVAEFGDILMSVRAPVGPVNFANSQMCIGRGLAAIRAGSNIDVEFLFNYLIKNGSEITGKTGAVFNSINKSQIEDILIPLPPLPEQQRIVSILDRCFTAIDKAKANAEQNLKNAKELFESYLQDVFEKKGEGWVHVRLGDICLINDGTHFSPKNSSIGDYMYITAKNIKPYYIDLSNVSLVSAEDHKVIFSRCSPRKGDVLYIKDGATAGVATVNTIDQEFSLLSSVALLKCSSTILNTFLVYYMNSSVGKKNFLGYIDGAAITRLTLEKIKNIGFAIPSFEKQQNIVLNLDSIRSESQKLEAIYQQKIKDLEELKKSILQKAFSGELSDTELYESKV